jgi:hypothetical protein
MTHSQRTLDYLWSLASQGASNAAIANHLGTTHQTAFMLTQDLLRKGLIRGEQRGRTWICYAAERPIDQPIGDPPDRRSTEARAELTPYAFEALARHVLSQYYGVELAPGQVGEVRKTFDLVSPDGQVVGDAKYYTRVGGTKLPPAKFATIAEHVWLLEHTGAAQTFLVFGNDREVPALWLVRYGNLVGATTFYYLDDDGQIECLWPPQRRDR